jgi:hypothetical protein
MNKKNPDTSADSVRLKPLDIHALMSLDIPDREMILAP